MLPSNVIYVVHEHPPIIPMIISLSLGVLIAAVSSRSRHKNIFSLALSTAAVLMIVFASVKTQSMNTMQITNLGVAIAETVNKYPVSLYYSMTAKNWKIM
ncbi:hypothetical protein AALA78_13915 [Lachnospiraceae bacterium 42-17]|jgi:ABC-2 type transport system permease protein|nr:hypothetical protein [Dorea sp.]